MLGWDLHIQNLLSSVISKQKFDVIKRVSSAKQHFN